MGCLNIRVSQVPGESGQPSVVDSALHPTFSILGLNQRPNIGIVDDQNLHPIFSIFGLNRSLTIGISDIAERLKVWCSLVCGVNKEHSIRFEKESLAWSVEENVIGVTKYNTLFATGQWKIEDVEIEELL